MASRADLIMAQLRGQGAQIYRKEPEEGNFIDDLTVGVQQASVAYEAFEGLKTGLNKFGEKFYSGEFEGDNLLDRIGSRFGERAFGEEFSEKAGLKYFQGRRDRKQDDYFLKNSEITGFQKIGDKYFNLDTGESYTSYDDAYSAYAGTVKNTNVVMGSNGTTTNGDFDVVDNTVNDDDVSNQTDVINLKKNDDGTYSF